MNDVFKPHRLSASKLRQDRILDEARHTADPVHLMCVFGIRSRVVAPVQAGALTAFLVTGMSPGLLGWTLLSNVAPDAATLSSHPPFRADYPVPVWGRDLIAAARVFAVADGLDSDGLLLSRGIGPAGRTLADTARQCGLRLGPGMLDLRRHGWHTQADYRRMGP
ncbi:hypothetical protein AB0I81_51445 [Nonomuraea sp. NPDC050404]|uniref:hypothetical protein n=1 Tax=Nonomuraea sp. NPDC050404 TaxID=3155783 RepID=UPI0033E5CFCE